MSSLFRLALLGTGTVGGGVADLIARNKERIAERTGVQLEIGCAVARNLERARARVPEGVPVVGDWRKALADYGCDVAVELIGGLDDARECALAAAAAGLPLVTANKALLATHGSEILEACSDSGVYFEAAVAGCIPAIRVLNGALAGDRLQRVRGIVNGTCNYMLTRMARTGCSSAEALAEAQQLGYAEADPALDVDGFDAAHKAVIMAWLAFGTPLTMDGIPVAGVRDLAAAENRYAAEFGFRIKLLANAELTDDGVAIWVGPALVADDHLLAKIEGSMNAVLAEAEAAGPLSLIGAGAGAEPTASAVMADLIDCALDKRAGRVPSLPRPNGTVLLPQEEYRCQSYMRLAAIDEPGVLAAAASELARHGISVEAIRQPESRSGEQVDIILLLHEASWGALQNACSSLRELPAIRAEPVLLPIAVAHTPAS